VRCGFTGAEVRHGNAKVAFLFDIEGKKYEKLPSWPKDFITVKTCLKKPIGFVGQRSYIHRPTKLTSSACEVNFIGQWS
jgi:hypothetical protein